MKLRPSRSWGFEGRRFILAFWHSAVMQACRKSRCKRAVRLCGSQILADAGTPTIDPIAAYESACRIKRLVIKQGGLPGQGESMGSDCETQSHLVELPRPLDISPRASPKMCSLEVNPVYALLGWPPYSVICIVLTLLCALRAMIST